MTSYRVSALVFMLLTSDCHAVELSDESLGTVRLNECFVPGSAYEVDVEPKRDVHGIILVMERYAHVVRNAYLPFYVQGPAYYGTVRLTFDIDTKGDVQGISYEGRTQEMRTVGKAISDALMGVSFGADLKVGAEKFQWVFNFCP